MSSAPPSSRAGLLASQNTRRTLLALGIIAVLVALDLWSKSAIFTWLGWPHDPNLVEGLVRDGHGRARYPLIGEWFALMPSRNYGAAWGMFDQYPMILVIGRIAAVLLMGFWILRSQTSQRLFRFALILVSAGALGNLHDNLFITDPSGDSESGIGPVRDFIDVYFSRWDWHFPIFNVADSCITVGAVLLLLSGFFPSLSEAQEEAEGPATAAPPETDSGRESEVEAGPGAVPQADPEGAELSAPIVGFPALQ